MIVSELIGLLQKFPQDALVILNRMSDYDDLEPDDIQLRSGKTPERKAANGATIWASWIGRRERDGHIMEISERWVTEGREENLEPLTVVILG